MPVPGVPTALRDRFRNRRGDDEIIYLISPAGFPNYGDELIARAWLRELARRRPRAMVVLDCHSPGQAGLLLRDLHPRAVFVDTLWQLTHYASDRERTDGPDPDTPWIWVADAATRLGPAPRLAEGVDVFRRATSVHILGGGYLNAVWPQHVSLVAAVAELTRATGVPVYATGQGLLPQLGEPAWSVLRKGIEDFAVFDCRDAASADALAGAGSTRHTGDDAWLGLDDPDVVRTPDLEQKPGSSNPGGAGAGVTLCVQGDLADEFSARGRTGLDALTEFVRATLDAWEVPGEAVTVIEGIPGRDREVPLRLGERLKGARTIPFLGVWRRGLPVGFGDTWISTRFHPHLVAAAAGDSGVAVIPRPDYYATKHGSLTAGGSRWTVVDDPEVIPEPPSAGGFDGAARRRAVSTKRALADELYPR
ncbi:polysaccharide pyruvyl transferase family protein [Gordonia sp. PKS22-38]|uniref:Polysaccharide pyruvyl transferase family protein n=1 Tax=Gordonia prachuapensis TaxID=3115651 RepID=A0ABU7MXV6_9ACTN|nr:polysaccharide pyruvyl transferase family protein [Gordonia sp. PKS22-38]